MALIHILDKQSDGIIGTLNIGEYTNDEKVLSSDNENTFDFTALKKFDLLQKRNRLLLQDKDGFFSEYLIIYAEQNSRNQKLIKSNATFTDLQKAKIIEPQVLQGATADTATTKALEGTEWRKGKVDYNGIRTLKIEEYTNPYNLLKIIASEFGLDLRFRVAVEGNKIARYVDLTLPDDEFDGKEVVFGKDLIGLRRIEDAQNIVTALLVLGPEKEDGTRLTVLVEDNDALQRWGRNGQHLIEVYEPQITVEDVTVERLRTLGQNELQKRIDALVKYECQAAILEDIPGKEHEKVRLDRTIRIKDEGYTPPLYLEAKVLEIKEQPSTGKILDFKLGNYKEFSKTDLEAQIAGLKKLLAQKASNAKLVETYELALQQAEEKADQAEENAKGYTDAVKVQVVEHANTVANQAENNAKSHADTVAEQAESNAKAYALSEADKARIAAIQAAATDAQTKVNAAKTALEASIAEKADAEWVNGKLQLKVDTDTYNTKVNQLINDIAEKADLEYVNGKLVSKADKNNTYTKTEVDNALNSKVSTTTYTTDKQGIVSRLDNAESRITQTEKDITQRVTLTTFDSALAGKENTVYKQNTAPAHANGRLWLDTSKTPNILYRSTGTAWVKATPTTAAEVGAYSQTDGTALAGRVSTAESTITQQAGLIALKANQSTVDTLKGRVDSAESQLTIQAGQIASKVDKTSYDTDKNGIITRLNSAESRITQTEKDITSKVSQTTYSQKVAELESSLSQKETPAGAQAKADAAKSAAISYADKKVDGIQVGGRNLLRNTLEKLSGTSTTPNASNVWSLPVSTRWYKGYGILLEKDQTYTLSFDYSLDWTNSVSEMPTTKKSIGVGVGTTRYVNGVYDADTFATIADFMDYGDGYEKGKFIFTFTYNYDATIYFAFRALRTNIDCTGLAITISNIKLEKGNKATDWSPAPEDAETKITALETRMSTAETGIQQTASAIELKANKTDVYTKTEADNKITTAVNNAKSEIKVTTDSISQSVSSLQSTVNSQGTRLSSAESSITSLSTQIQSKVSQTDMQNIGSTNLIHNSEFKENANYWVLGSGWSLDSSTKLDTSNAMKIVRTGLTADTWAALYSEFIDCAPGQEFVASVYTFVTDRTTFDRGFFLEFEWFNGGSRITITSMSILPSNNNEWQRFIRSGVAPANTTRMRIRFHPNRNGTGWIARPMLQRGSIATAWMPHIDEQATALTARLSTAESTITQQADLISQKVSKTDYNGNTIASLINQTAEEVTISAQKINFDGHVFGTNATFKGKLEGVVLITEGPDGSITLNQDSLVSESLDVVTRGITRAILKGGRLKLTSGTGGGTAEDELYFSINGMQASLRYGGSWSIQYDNNLLNISAPSGVNISKELFVDNVKLIDIGTNANGTYIRYSNGIQICYGNKETTNNINLAIGSIYHSGSNTWTYPATFIDIPEVQVNVKGLAPNAWAGLGDSGVWYDFTSFDVFSATPRGYKGKVSLFAIGRWK